MAALAHTSLEKCHKYHIPRWKEPTRIKSNSRPHIGPPKTEIIRLRALSRCSLNSGSPFHAHRPVVRPLSLTPSCPSPDTAPHCGPWVLLLVTRERFLTANVATPIAQCIALAKLSTLLHNACKEEECFAPHGQASSTQGHWMTLLVQVQCSPVTRRVWPGHCKQGKELTPRGRQCAAGHQC